MWLGEDGNQILQIHGSALAWLHLFFHQPGCRKYWAIWDAGDIAIIWPGVMSVFCSRRYFLQRKNVELVEPLRCKSHIYIYIIQLGVFLENPQKKNFRILNPTFVSCHFNPCKPAACRRGLLLPDHKLSDLHRWCISYGEIRPAIFWGEVTVQLMGSTVLRRVVSTGWSSTDPILKLTYRLFFLKSEWLKTSMKDC